MKQGKNVIKQPKRRGSKRVSALTVSILLTAVFVVGGTLAYIITNTKPVNNTFTPTNVDCAVAEEVSGTVKSSIKIQNTGNIDACIRVAVIGNTVDADGKITASFNVDDYFAGAGWTKGDDGYYYWGDRVAPGDTTGELFKDGAAIDFAGANVTILADAIQADGVASTVGTAGKTPSQIAWGRSA